MVCVIGWMKAQKTFKENNKEKTMINFGLYNDYLDGYNTRLNNEPFDKLESDDWKMGWLNANQALKNQGINGDTKTNAEMIRNMNDDELVSFIRSVYLAGKNVDGFGMFDFNLEAWLQKQSTN
jgi:hypothetical protein